MAISKKSALRQLRWLLLLPIPLLWCILGSDQGVGEKKDPLTLIERFLKIDPGYQSRNGALTFLENKLVDQRFHYRYHASPPKDPLVKVVYVDVDSKSIDVIGNVPWTRSYFARVSKALIEHAGVKAVGIDFVFSDVAIPEAIDRTKLTQGNRELAAYVFRTPSVVLAASYAAAEFSERDGDKKLVHLSRNFPILMRNPGPVSGMERPETPSFIIGRPQRFAPPGIGLIDTIEAGTRSVFAYAPSDVRTYYHMAIELARVYYGVKPDGIKVSDTSLDFVRPDGSVAASVPLHEKQLVELNWFSPWIDERLNPRAPFYEVYAYSQNLDSADPAERQSAKDYFAQPVFKDAIVLIGPVDSLLQDVATTPMDDTPVPKVGVHGNFFKTIISGQYMRRPSDANSWALVFGLTLLVTCLAMAGGRVGVQLKVLAALAWAGYAALAFWLFNRSNLILPMTAPLLSAFTTSFAGVMWQLHEEEKKANRIKGLFGTYLAPAIVEQMVDSGTEPELGGVEEKITAYFSDIVGFSTFSEILSPQQLTELLNEFLTACTDIIQADGGTLDKYIGDAVVAIYGAPYAFKEHGYRACVSALRVQKKIAELRAKWKSEEGKWPEIVHKLQTRIGLNSGLAVVGNMGSTTRFAYTMMGDNVNLAARMESGAKAWGVFTMCTEATKAECDAHSGDPILFRPLGRIVVKGRTKAVPIFEIVALKEDSTDSLRECVELFGQAMAKFYAREWDAAIGLFKQSSLLEPNQPGKTPGVKLNPSILYMAKCEEFKLAPPPPDWDGVEHMTEK